LWFGRFEFDEGYHVWNLNSSGEWITTSTVYEGEHALALSREHNASDNVVTMMARHLPAEPENRYSVSGWMATENAENAKFSVRFYSTRYTWNHLSNEDMGAPVDGTTDWTYYTASFAAPEHGNYLNVRCNLDRPNSDVGFAYFDDLRIMEWLPWEALALPLDIPHPNNYRFVQLRVPYEPAAVTVSYEETALVDGDFPQTLPPAEERPPVQVLLRGANPNPFRSGTTISYRLSATAEVSLEIFDVTGRMVARMADKEVQRPGWHRVTWEADQQPSGVYFTRLQVDGQAYARKMVLMR
jgi:hypothetical protein